MALETPPGSGAAPTFPMNVEKAWIAATRFPPLLFPTGALDKYDAMGPSLEAALIPMEHRSHWFLQKPDVLFLRKMVWLFSAASGMTELGSKVDR